MTVRAILMSMLRHWYVVIVAIAMAAVAAYGFQKADGVYSTSTVVSFTRSADASLIPYNGSNDTSVISFAGAVARAVNDGQDPQGYADESAPFYGAGVRTGVDVSLANDGGQWSDSFSTADIDIDIVGTREAWVAGRQKQLIAAVTQTANSQQAQLDIPTSDRFAVSVVPATVQIIQITAARRAKLMAIAALGSAAVFVAGAASVTLDKLTPRRRVRRASWHGRATRRSPITENHRA